MTKMGIELRPKLYTATKEQYRQQQWFIKIPHQNKKRKKQHIIALSPFFFTPLHTGEKKFTIKLFTTIIKIKKTTEDILLWYILCHFNTRPR